MTQGCESQLLPLPATGLSPSSRPDRPGSASERPGSLLGSQQLGCCCSEPCPRSGVWASCVTSWRAASPGSPVPRSSRQRSSVFILYPPKGALTFPLSVKYSRPRMHGARAFSSAPCFSEPGEWLVPSTGIWVQAEAPQVENRLPPESFCFLSWSPGSWPCSILAP